VTSGRLSGILPIPSKRIALKIDPSSRDNLSAWLRLTLVPGVSPRDQRKLLSQFGSPREVLSQCRAAIIEVCGDDVAGALARGANSSQVDAALRWAEQEGHHLVGSADPAYPQALLNIHVPPSVLYVRGRVELLNSKSFAVVGSRNATPQGLRDAEAFAAALSAAGLCIVSGLAAGIDAAAHRGGMAHAGGSIAVMGTGADRLYPARNRALAEELARSGCLVSEFPLGTPPEAGNFPRRNRLISGLACGVLVVEAAIQSGSLITARTALEQNRDVFAIPGSIHSPLSKGCHDLIKQGAKLVESAEDILADIGMARAPAGDAPEKFAAAADPLLDIIGFAPVTMDEIAHRTGFSVSTISASLSRLEIDGQIAAIAGGLFQRLEATT
jgi:DNA processing protein